MANHSKAKHHHSKAGACLDSGDMKGAAHHMGHALAALRSSAPSEPSGGAVMADDEGYEAVPAPKQSIRDRLKGMKK